MQTVERPALLLGRGRITNYPRVRAIPSSPTVADRPGATGGGRRDQPGGRCRVRGRTVRSTWRDRGRLRPVPCRRGDPGRGGAPTAARAVRSGVVVWWRTSRPLDGDEPVFLVLPHPDSPRGCCHR